MSLERDQQPDEAALIRQAQEGDRASFEQLYRLHSGRVFALCRRLSAKVEDAEELAQEVFVRAWQHMNHFQSPDHFSAWTRRVATNMVINERRTRARRGVTSMFDETDASQAAEPAPASDDSRFDLESAISRVPRRARTVFVMHDVYGYHHREIAEITGVAVGTSKALLH
ncbi:MAG: RNA polymerase sigma factor, partial [Acidobacteriota bacterium]|nr:RNA polymerase sigma factor [Acidobacteriota bacterium]